MKLPLLLVLACAVSVTACAQYYYKDVVVSRQTSLTWQHFKAAAVHSVVLHSIEADGKPTEGFDCKQLISPDFLRIETHTLSNNSSATTLLATYNASGQLQQTLDTSEHYRSQTFYEYDPQGRIQTIRNSSVETDNQVTQTENHFWEYRPDGCPLRMTKIKNEKDTTWVELVCDDHGQVTEEHPRNTKLDLPATFYYSDSLGRLTDIVRYNVKAQRLLPDFVFEYESDNQLRSMLYVVEGTGAYQKWQYSYDARRLRIKDVCYGKGQELLGSILYSYEAHP